MKCLMFFLFIQFTLIFFSVQLCYSQVCGTQPIDGVDPNPHNFRGGFYKPATSNIFGAPSNSFFPVLVVFVQFKNESGDSTTTNFDSWPARRKPNYFDSTIAPERDQTNIDWWDKYNGYAISDYWHEFSRGKLHVKGQAISIILSHEINWYADSGIAKINREIYDTLKNRLKGKWKEYDQWKYISDGVFAWQKDSLVDMMYTVFRSHRSFISTFAGGEASLGNCNGSINNAYTVFDSSGSIVKLFASGTSVALGSGTRVFADSSSPYSRQEFLDAAFHEHSHYLFLFNHRPYGKMQGLGLGGGWEFSLSPWEVIKLGYMKPKFPNYSSPAHYLYDYSSRGQNGTDTCEIIQIPISSDSLEFFLITNRRKVSQWDRRMGGDTLAFYRWQYLKNINPEYGKGLYIYHNRNGYEFLAGSTNTNLDIDMECADGLWSWENAGLNRPVAYKPDTTLPVVRKVYPSYNNDYPALNDPGYTSGKDEMSKGIIFTPGSADNFTNPIGRGTHSLYTNENDYWYSFANIGDRWDGWNVGYNEVFSPYSSPNTNAMDNSYTGIFVWYQSLNGSTKQATIKIYRASGFGGSTALDTILRATPPSRPMGLRVLSCDSLPTVDGYLRVKLRWNHNMEPDMRRLVLGSSDTIKHYKIFRSVSSDMSEVPPDAMQYPEQYYDEIATVDIYTNAICEYTDTIKSICNFSSIPGEPWHEYPVRYRVQAIDKYDSASVLSDFAKTSAWITPHGGVDEDNILVSTNENIPKEYSLKQNYPNPFNPVTNIQYDLPFDNFVTIKIYNVLGKEVATLVNELKNAGSYIVSFNGSGLSSGIYYYKIEAGSFKQVRQMVMIK